MKEEKPDSAKRPTTDDRFDLANLRLPRDFDKLVGVKKILTTVPVRRPNKQWFVRVHPEEEWRETFGLLEFDEDNEVYLVHPKLVIELASEVVRKRLFSAINKHGDFFFWPVRLADSDGRLDSWNRSAMEAVELATRKWISIESNRTLGAYEPFIAEADYPEPEWPDMTFDKLIEIAFRDRFIDSLDHPVVRKLRGRK